MNVRTNLRYILPFALIFAVLFALAPRSPKWGFDYKKGSTWKYETLFAPFDFPILKTEDQILSERSLITSETVPYYKYSYDVVAKSLQRVAQTDFGGGQWASVADTLAALVEKVYRNGILPADEMGFTDAELVYVHRDKRAQMFPADELYSVASSRAYVESYLSSVYPDAPLDSLQIPGLISSVLVPNLTFDSQTTALVNSSKENVVSPTLGYVKAGQLLVSEGEVITSDIAQVLDSFKTEFESNVSYSKNRLLMWIGNGIFALLILLCLILCLHFSFPRIFNRPKQLMYVVSVVVLFSSVTLIIQRINPQLLFLVPFTACALYLEVFFRSAKVVPVYVVTLLPLLLFCKNGFMFFTMYLVAGLFSFALFPKFNRGVRQFLMALMTFGILTVVFVGFQFLGLVNYAWLSTVLYLFVGSMLTVAVFPLIFLSERVFDLVSENRLSEICDSTAELLSQLEKKAPGTFQHSLQVKNMSQACARALGAKEMLVKAGSLYHDIGKMVNPMCFVENESLNYSVDNAKYHSELSPMQSAQDIIRHVTDGIELARGAHLPKIVVQFIQTHHGTGCVEFFYDKFLKSGGDPSMRSEFCYPGKKPTTIEQTIVMLCDSFEASSRTLSTYTPQSVSDLVERIVDGKISSGQLSETEMTIHEIEELKSVVKQYILQVHHERISYPKRKNK